MKTFKKIQLGITALVIFLPYLLAMVPSASAAGACGNQPVCLDQGYWDNATYTLPSKNTINVANGARVQFQQAVGNIYDVTPPNSMFNGTNGLCGTSAQNTITLSSPDFSKPTLSGTLHVEYSVTSTNQQGQSQINCTTYTKTLNNITNLTINGNNGTCTYAACSNNDIKNSLSSFKLTSDPSVITGTFVNGRSISFTDGNTSDTNHTFSAPIGTFCSGGGNLGSIVIQDTDYQKILSSKENPVPGVLDVDWYNASNKSCNNYSPSNTAPINIDTSAYLSSIAPGAPCSPPGATQGNLICGGTNNTACSSQGCTWATATPNTPATSCESASFTSLEWIFCPVLRMFDGIAQGLTGIIQNLLDFETNRYLNPQVKNTWSIMRNISSALLVIIMLLAVIAQAVGGGPVDAYTLRKILPRLVAAVILIQISWFMLIWIISLANDLGYGVRDLISAPFGGYGNLDLAHLIAPLGITGSAVTAALFTSIGIAFAFSGLTIGGLFLLALGAVLTDFMAFILLVLRLVIVVMAVIFFPIAMLAWILPGTQRYWKMWWDNFIKILMLFPLIMAMVYAGRIFAQIFISASAGSTLDKSIAVFVLFIGFFGPYWFIPKAFKWGGQIFSAASTGLMNATQGARNWPGQFAMRQAKATREQRSTDRNERLSYGRGRFGDRVLAAAGGFGLNRRAFETRRARQTAEGREAGEKAVAQAIIGSAYETQDHAAKLVTLDNLAQGQFDPATGLSGDNPAMQRWALDQLATFGDWDRIDGLRTGGHLDERTWQSFVAKNISAIHQNAPYLSPIRRDMSALGYQEAATWKDHSFHEFERQIATGQVRTPDGQGYEAHADPDRQLALGVDFAERALSDERVRANISAEGIATLERIRDMASPQVRLAQVRRGNQQVTEARIPSPRLIQGNATARQNLTASLISTDPNRANATRGALASSLADQTMDPNSRQVMEGYLTELRTQGQAGSAEARQAYNAVLQQWQTQLAGRVQQAEQAAVAQGLPGPAIAQARANAQNALNAEAARIQGAGFTPLP